MAVGLETLHVCQAVELLSDGPLEGIRGRDVAHLAATRAEEMVVVLGEILRQLEPCEVVVGGDPPHDPGCLKVDQMAVRGAPRQVRPPIGYVADAHRVTRAHEHLDDRAPSRGVALVDTSQSALDHTVQVFDHGVRHPSQAVVIV